MKKDQNTNPISSSIYKRWKTLVGVLAKRQAVTNPENTIFSAKRFIGHKYSEVTEEDSKHIPYKSQSEQWRR